MDVEPRREPSPAGPSFGIAFGGGGARGLAHIHVIEALDELGIRPVTIAGSSIGAIMGAAMAAGMAGRDIHAYARSILTRRAEVAGRMWRARPASIAEAMAGGLRFTQFNIQRILTVFLPEQVPSSFEALGIPLKVTATDYYGHQGVIYSQGDLLTALAASAAIPAVFQPVRRDGLLLIDGGIYNPVPFDVIAGEADIIVAIDVVGAPVETGPRPPTSIDLMFGATQLMMQSIIAGKLRQSQPHVRIRAPVSRFRALDFMKMEAVMAETVSIKDELKRAIEAAISLAEAGHSG